MNAEMEEALAALKQTMQSNNWRIESILTFTHGIGLQVYVVRPPSKRWTKVGPLLFPPEGGSVADVVTMLGSMTAKEAVR